MKNIAYKYRIYPNKKQIILLSKTFGCVRFVYNKMLEDKNEYYKKHHTLIGITPAHYKKDYVWLKEVDSLALANAQRNLEKAFISYFKNEKAGFPKFKSKHRSRDSYTTNMVNNNIRISNHHIHLPKVGDIRWVFHRPIPDGYQIKSVTVSRTPCDEYYASICLAYKEPTIVKSKKIEKEIGLDYSMSELYVDSLGNQPSYPKYYRQSEKKLAKQQRKLSKMREFAKLNNRELKDCSNYQKQRKRLAKIHQKVANQRKDFLHKLSNQIANDYDVVCVEDLNMKAMSQALNFGKSVSDNGWGMFINFLTYKLENRDKELIKIGAWYASSQTCHVCGYKNKEVKNLSVRRWVCPVCGTQHDRDTNAAINILKEGLRTRTLLSA